MQKAAETFLPPLESKEGIFMDMEDKDGTRVWNFKYRSATYTYIEMSENKLKTLFYDIGSSC